MSNTKHTPEEWKLGEKSEGHVSPENDTVTGRGWDYKKYWVKSGDKIIGEVFAMQTDIFLNDFDQFEANAKLIAAAPDMLEALQKIAELRHPDRSCSLEAQGYSEQECAVIANNDYAAGIAIEAIKKATE